MRLSKPVIAVRANHWMQGFSLVELMIALVLGLLLIGAVVNVFISNRQTYRTTENMARQQENARFAFELLEQDIREAGGIPCGRSVVVNAISGGGGWWDWNNGTLIGYDDYDGTNDDPNTDGPAVSNRVTGTDAILVLSATQSEPSFITAHVPNPSAGDPSFTLNALNGISGGDIVMASDGQSAAIFQVATAGAGVITYNTSGSNPGNLTTSLGPGGTVKTFTPGGMISEYSASFWYIGNNGRGGQSLYRLGFSGNPSATGIPVEMVDGITGMQIDYLTDSAVAYTPASPATTWDNVVAVRITLTLTTGENVGTGGLPITRSFTHVISLRNRENVS